jgi:hypothetical protein
VRDHRLALGRSGSVLLSAIKFSPAIRVEVVVIDHTVSVETEQIILGCADLNELCHSFFSLTRGAPPNRRKGGEPTGASESDSTSGATTTVVEEPDRRGHDA